MASNQPQYTCLDPSGVPSVVVNAAAATGSASSYVFTVMKAPEGGGTQVTLQAVKGGTVTACTIQLLASLAGGTPSVAQGAALDFVATPTQIISPNLTPGATYMLNVATITGGGTMTVTASAV